MRLSKPLNEHVAAELRRIVQERRCGAGGFSQRELASCASTFEQRLGAGNLPDDCMSSQGNQEAGREEKGGSHGQRDAEAARGLVVRMAGDDPMLFCLAVAHWARSQPQQTVESLVCALLERRLSEDLESLIEVRREGDLQKGRLLAWMKAIAKARPDLFSKAGLQYVATLPLEHLLPFARFLAAAEGVDELMRELAGGERNGQPPVRT